MHSDTLKLALCAEHENAKCHRVHVTFLNGKRVAIAASSDASVITDSQRLSVCEHMGWTIQRIGNQWMVQILEGRWIDASTLRLALDAAIERTPTDAIDAAIRAQREKGEPKDA